jgi:3-oxoacyl-[acyl-carrier-protein] synthase-3
MAQVPADQIDNIVIGTVTPDRQFPSTACMVQKELMATEAAAMDVSAGCSGFLYALTVARNAICCGTSKTALVIGVERLSSIVNWKDRSTCVLLGDGAGAVILKATETPGGILSSHLKSDGTSWDLLFSDYGNSYVPEILQPLNIKPFHLKMTGNRLFKQAVGCLTAIARQALEHNGLTLDDVDLVIPHQANIRIINAMAESLDIPHQKLFTNVHKYGNTSSASIPIALDEAHRDHLLTKEKIALLISFGAGLTWGAVVLKWAI